MKVVVFFAIVAICLHCCVECASVPPVPPNQISQTMSTTTPKSWAKKIKDGVGTFLQGAAVVGAFQGAYANHKATKHIGKIHSDAKPH